MNKWIYIALVTFILNLGLCNLVLADHDSGLGKSQDGQGDLSSLSTAPEPSTVWLFLAGALGIASHIRRKECGVELEKN